MSDPTVQRIHQEFAATDRIIRTARRYAARCCRKQAQDRRTINATFVRVAAEAVKRLAAKADKRGIVHWCCRCAEVQMELM